MGSILSRVRLAARVLQDLSAKYDEVAMKVAESPGLPVINTSTPYWAIPPAPIACHGAKDPIPPLQPGKATERSEAYVGCSDADVVIIGSGVTGAAVARTLLDWDAQRVREHGGPPIRVIMLEARDACSGATARNGGHITPPLYHDYSSLKKEFGAAIAQRIIRFRLAHLQEFLRVAEEEGLLIDSQARRVQTFDVFFDRETFLQAKAKLEEYSRDMPNEGKVYSALDPVDGVDLVEEYQLSPGAAGCITTTAGAIHPYRLITGILSRLLNEYSDQFYLYTHTPCISIASPKGGSLYTISTPKGTLHAPHVVHATNGWVSHLLEPLRGKIIPLRATMTAQRPGLSLGAPLSDLVRSTTIDPEKRSRNWLGDRSFVFYPRPTLNVWDYLTQMPPSSAGLKAQQARRPTKDLSPMRSDSSHSDADSDTACGSSDGDMVHGHERDDTLSSSAKPHYPPPAAELMFGGGLGQSQDAFYDSAGNADDRTFHLPTASYLSGALPLYFSGWGEEGRDTDAPQSDVDPGRVKSVWTGILGMSADGMPWVGRIPDKISGRVAPSSAMSTQNLASPGEWIAAGYSGEGMVHAWMSAKAVAYMILNADDERERNNPLGRPANDGEDWLPKPYLVSEKRLKESNMDKFLESFLG
ncbi:hypothetical protein PC9H_004166 [Pleurotus ostreatus]|uniref:FAD dependent oxidoreductase domain-containing protein n=1 Tax=Pleurotus ostreatus TaxID=5322 RepID=A0A8H7A3B4_PLEOS|nr:uncharacterized protein PC9H_004166 [Pleurotus ostreatus]KAF7437327.1 hypothetical protein PC9H_004166 [Pleurotus ostreatus]